MCSPQQPEAPPPCLKIEIDDQQPETCNEDRSVKCHQTSLASSGAELVLATPFGTFHRDPHSSFWPRDLTNTTSMASTTSTTMASTSTSTVASTVRSKSFSGVLGRHHRKRVSATTTGSTNTTVCQQPLASAASTIPAMASTNHSAAALFVLNQQQQLTLQRHFEQFLQQQAFML